MRHDLKPSRLHLFTLDEDERASEAVFSPASPNAREGEGWLVTVVCRPGRGSSSLLVFGAEALDQGPVAEVALPRRVPFSFHGSWVPA